MNANAKEIATVAQDPMTLLQRAVDANLDVDKLGRLMELQERWQAQEAKRAFNAALTKFQSVCPSMKRTKEIKHGNTVISRYASLDEIRKTIQPYLKKFKLTATFEIEPGEEIIRLGCKVAHVNGHSETTWMSAEADVSGAKNSVQARGSTVSYLQRYSLIAALGITSADEDDDGAGSGPEISTQLLEHNTIARDWLSTILQIKDNLAEGGDLSAAAECYAEMPRKVMMTLNRAPTKGGLWTTEERNRIKSDKEFQKLVHQHCKESGWYDREENKL